MYIRLHVDIYTKITIRMVIPMVTPIAVEYICLLTDKRIVDIEAGF